MLRNIADLAPRMSVRAKSGYVAPGGRTAVPRRAGTKLRSEDVRPAIYYKFDQTVQLSDGSTIKRKSVFPRQEWKMLSDQRNNPLWNPSKPDVRAIQLDASGKLAKFKRKFGELGATDAAASDAAADSTQEDSSAFSLDDIMSEDAEQVTTGRLHQVNQKKKKK